MDGEVTVSDVVPFKFGEHMTSTVKFIIKLGKYCSDAIDRVEPRKDSNIYGL